MDAPAEEPSSLPAARFGDRLNAFALDASLFSCGALFSAMGVIASRGGGAPPEAFMPAWMLLWGGAFVLYHAYLGSEGRQTLGKRLFGISVVRLDGETPTFGAALGRTFGYIASSLFLNLGFLWALRKDGRAWHDKLAGTRVVETAGGVPALRAASTAVSVVVAASMTVGWLGLAVVGPGMARMKLLAQARVGLKSVALLQDEHKKATGAYTADLQTLLDGTSEEAAEVRRALRFHLNQDTVKITVGESTYSIEAEAHDEQRTALRLEGPGSDPDAP